MFPNSFRLTYMRLKFELWSREYKYGITFETAKKGTHYIQCADTSNPVAPQRTASHGRDNRQWN